MMSRELALFDFDGTLTRKDSLADFLLWLVGPWPVLRGAVVLAPTLLSHAAGRLDNQRAKERVLTHFIGGWTRDAVVRAGERYAVEQLPRILRPAALERLEWHRLQGHEVAVVTASPREWVEPWTAALGLTLLASELEYVADRATGRLAGANCHGDEKVRRIRGHYDPSAFERLHAYGDTGGDRPMLALADEAHWRPFR